MEPLGVRELRSELAAAVRRAGAGERLVITVDGHPTAQLGPLSAPGAPTIDDLAAAGLVRLPATADHPEPPEPATVPVDTRVDRVLSEVRGDLRRSR